MKKLAVFVEGLTEQLFVDKFITEIAGGHAIAIERRKFRGGSRSGPRLMTISASAPTPDHKYYILIVDCTSDTRVKSEIRDQYESLVSSGYSAIIGIRDVYPEFTHPDIPRLRRMLDYRMKTNPIRVAFILGIMEVETWFVSEHTHLVRMDPRLTPGYISNALGFDPSIDDMQLRPHPAADLDHIYSLVGRRYKKVRANLQHTVDLLDCAHLYLEVLDRIPDLKALAKSIDAFLAS